MVLSKEKPLVCEKRETKRCVEAGILVPEGFAVVCVHVVYLQLLTVFIDSHYNTAHICALLLLDYAPAAADWNHCTFLFV